MWLNERPIILASASPRRQELLKKAGLNFRVIKPEVEEIYPEGLSPQEVTVYLAKLKAEALKDSLEEDEVIISADTIVSLDNTIYGKPRDAADAVRILGELSGKKHTVISGVCLQTRKKEISFHEETDVYFHPLTEEEIRYYVDQWDPMDKAGAYAIQEWIGLVGISRIDGCYFNVMGLPVQKLYQALKQI